jgi:hypothetical protein
MTVTQELSVGLAVAQWLRSPRGTSIARERLRELGVPEDEIERRRRARSEDRALAGILRLAVTLVIARGRLERADLGRVKPAPSEALLREIAAAVALAFYNVAIAESVDRTAYPAIDMSVGDY